jgi:hypothetical protein
LRGNNALYRQPSPGWPVGHPGVSRPQGVIGVSVRLLLITLLVIIVTIVRLMMELTFGRLFVGKRALDDGLERRLGVAAGGCHD